MKYFVFWFGVLTVIIATTHGFITGQSIVHSLLFHPLVILVGLMAMAYGINEEACK